MNTDHAEMIVELMDKYGRSVFSTAYKVLGNTDDAEDVLQEVFLHLLHSWRKIKPLDSVRNWGAYLKVSAINRAIDVLRRRSRWKEESLDLVQERELVGMNSPRYVAYEQQKAMFLRKALGQIPERDAKVFALRYIEDFSYEMIAEQLGLSVNQVGVILHRTRDCLKEILQPLVSVPSPNRLSTPVDICIKKGEPS